MAPRSRRLLLLLVVLVLFAYLLLPQPDPSIADGPVLAASGSDPVARALETPDRPDAPATAATPAPAERTPVEEALDVLAETAGEGRIRCAIPAELGEVAVDLSRVEQRGPVLHALVSEPAGAVVVRSKAAAPDCDALEAFTPDWFQCQIRRQKARAAVADPVGRLVWSQAWAGETGACTFGPANRVTLEGTVVFEDGSLAEAARVNGCLNPALVEPGRFRAEAVEGTTCSLLGSDYALEVQGRLEIKGAEPATGLRIVLEVEEEVEVDFGGMEAALQRSASRPNPLVVALATAGLSEDARAELHTWLDDETRARELQIRRAKESQAALERGSARMEPNGVVVVEHYTGE